MTKKKIMKELSNAALIARHECDRRHFIKDLISTKMAMKFDTIIDQDSYLYYDSETSSLELFDSDNHKIFSVVIIAVDPDYAFYIFTKILYDYFFVVFKR